MSRAEKKMQKPRSPVTVDQSSNSELDAVPIGLCVLSDDLRFLRINETMAQFNGYTPAEHLGRSLSEVVPDLEPQLRRHMKEVLETAKAIGPFEVAGETAAEPGALRFWMEYWSPVTNERGEIIGASIAAIDVTERKRIEREKDEALKLTERRLRQQTAIAELGQLALQDVAFQSVLDKAVEAASAALEVPLTKILAFEDAADKLKLVAGIGWEDGLVGAASVGIDQDSQAGFTLLANALVIVDDLQSEERFSGPALLRQHGVVSGMSIPIPATGDRPYGVLGIHATERRLFDQGDKDFLRSLAAIISNAVRKEAAKTQSKLLIREMAHRAGNMLQLVSSIAAQTFRHAASPSEAREAFNQRLASLARANHAIAQQGWVNTRFQKLVEETLSPFRDKIRFTGRDIRLAPELCFDLGLVLNELGTNSVKYGSLGAADGFVELSWSIDGPSDAQTLTVVWFDPVSSIAASPAGSPGGFGTKLIRQLVSSKWHGTIDTQTQGHFKTTLTIPVTMKADDL